MRWSGLLGKLGRNNMQIIQPSVKVSNSELVYSKVVNLERYARVCYQSVSRSDDPISFLSRIIAQGHESVIEHEKVTVTFLVDRGISNQIVRHRIASYSQESTRYCNYSSDKFGSEITVIEPFFYKNREREYQLWRTSCQQAESAYFALLENGTPEEARSVLPNSLKTELVTTYNFREWRHFFNLRCSKNAHPQLRQVTIPLLLLFREVFPPLFTDIVFDEKFQKSNYAKIIITEN